MRSFLAAILLLAGLSSASKAGDTLTPRMGLTQPAIGSVGWGQKISSDLAIIDSSAAIQALANTFSAANTFTAPITMTATSLNLTGPGGYITSGSSVNASAFFGNGANVTQVAAVTVPAAGVQAGTMGGSVIASSVAASGVTAGSFGSATQAPTFTVGVDGRLSAASAVTVTPAAASITAGTLGAAVIASSVAATGVTVGSFGTASAVPSITVGVDGRLSAAANTSIVIAESAVTNLVADLASKASTGTDNSMTRANALATLGASQVTIISTATIQGNAFSVGASSFSVIGGDVGIGIAAPTEKLHIVGTSMLLDAVSAGAGSTLNLNAAATSNPAVSFKQAGTTRGYIFYNNTTSALTVNRSGNNSDGILIDASNNVGIGTPSPSTALHVVGSMTVTGSGNITGGGGLTVSSGIGSYGGTNTTDFGLDTGGDIRLKSGARNLVFNNVSVQSNVLSLPTGATPTLGIYDSKVNIKSDGNVGIGTVLPTATMSVVGNGYFSGNLAVATTTLATDNLVVAGPTGAIMRLDNVVGNRSWRLLSNGADGSFAIRDETGTGNRIIVSTNGSVGIGVLSPCATCSLHVRGNINASAGVFASTGVFGGTATSGGAKLTAFAASTQTLRIGRSDATAYDIGIQAGSADDYLTFYGNQSGFNGYRFGGINGEKMVIQNNGNVGIGTTAPGAKLETWVAVSAASTTVIRMVNDGTGGGVGTTLGFNLTQAANVDPAYISSQYLASGDAVSSMNLSFATGGGGNAANAAGTPKMTISGLGNVGIGTLTPSSPLQVVGLVAASSFTATNDASFATSQTGRVIMGNTGAQSDARLDVRGMVVIASTVSAGGQWMRFQRSDLITFFDVLIASGTNNDNMQFRNNPGNILLDLERASNKVGIASPIGSGTELFYCAGGTFAGNVCRGSACICTGGTATALNIFVK